MSGGNPYGIPTQRYQSSAVLVPALRQLVDRWRARSYEGASETSKELLRWWFGEDHLLPIGEFFRYYFCQREAIETLIYCYEVLGAREFHGLWRNVAPEVPAPGYELWWDDLPRLVLKMATGAGKTKVMSLVIAWSYFHSLHEPDSELARNFLLIAPNVIVFERLREDFADGRVFLEDPVVPQHWEREWDIEVVLQDEPSRGTGTGTLYLTNIQRLYEQQQDEEDQTAEAHAQQTNPVSRLLPPRPPKDVLERREPLLPRVCSHDNLLVLNDEAHHVHDDELVWYTTIKGIHERLVHRNGHGVSLQADFSATPKDQNGILFPWTVVDYPLAQAIEDGIVKRPIIGHVENARETPSDRADVRYRMWLNAGVERWREYTKALAPSERKPVLFVMATTTREADEIGEYLETHADLAGKVVCIHTDRAGQVSKRDLDLARGLVREIDEPDNDVCAISSVLMLREGWDVRSVTVVVGLRPFTARAHILPEQAVGRGIRLMEGPDSGVDETVDIIGNDAFVTFVRELEEEGVTFGEFTVGEDTGMPETIQVDRSKLEYDLELPRLSPALIRHYRDLAELRADDVAAAELEPPSVHPPEVMHYVGRDALTQQVVIDRHWRMPIPANFEAVLGYYATEIARASGVPGRTAEIVRPLRNYITTRLFTAEVDADDAALLWRLTEADVQAVLPRVFAEAIGRLSVKEQPVQVAGVPLRLSQTAAFPWRRCTTRATKTVFNLVPCDVEAECDFARMLDGFSDVAAFAKLTSRMGFFIEYMDHQAALRLYYPDFAVADTEGGMYLIETKGLEGPEVPYKDKRAIRWCEHASELTGVRWEYLKAYNYMMERIAFPSLAELVRTTRALLD